LEGKVREWRDELFNRKVSEKQRGADQPPGENHAPTRINDDIDAINGSIDEFMSERDDFDQKANASLSEQPPVSIKHSNLITKPRVELIHGFASAVSSVSTITTLLAKRIEAAGLRSGRGRPLGSRPLSGYISLLP
jgi:hypothetical protein